MLQRNEDGHSPDKRFGSDRLGADSEDPDSEDHMRIPHAGPRRAVGNNSRPPLMYIKALISKMLTSALVREQLTWTIRALLRPPLLLRCQPVRSMLPT